MSNKRRQINPLRLFIVIIVLLIALILIVRSTIGVTKTVEKALTKDIEEEVVIEEPEIITGLLDNTNKEIIYLAKGDSYRLDYSFVSDKKDSDTRINYSSSNPSAVYVDLNGLIKAIDVGESIITISIGNYSDTVKIISTNLILPLNNTQIYSKPLLECDRYSEEENDLLDTILKERINDAGYTTRAGVVAAIRFLLIEFPYRISYFFENGRINYYADGEGRYYHEGLYLDESRFEVLTRSSSSGPKCWGCILHSYTANDDERNGLDCSGLVTWALYNGGFDPGDVGAGGKEYSKNTLFYLGDRINTSIKDMDKVQAGDLVHNEKGGGHIGIIIGIDEDNVYVAQATWENPNYFSAPYGVVIDEYTYQEFVKDWNEVMLMDSYYKESGNYQAMW